MNPINVASSSAHNLVTLARQSSAATTKETSKSHEIEPLLIRSDGTRMSPTYALTVKDVWPEAKNTVRISFEMPPGNPIKPGHVAGIPASLSNNKLDHLKGLLKPNPDFPAEMLIPHETPIQFHDGRADDRKGTELGYVTDNLLEKFSEAIALKPEIQRSPNEARLHTIMTSPDDKQELKDNFNVIDLVERLPNLVSSEDVYTGQKDGGARNVSRTYATEIVGDRIEMNIALVESHAERCLFPDDKEHHGVKSGGASYYLNNVKEGDTVLVNIGEGFKSKPPIPHFSDSNDIKEPTVMTIDGKDVIVQPKERPVCFLSQGNATIADLTWLAQAAQMIEEGKSIGPVSAGLAFKDEESILELERILPYIQNGTLDKLDIYLSESNLPDHIRKQYTEVFENGKVEIHHGTRIQDIFNRDDFSYGKSNEDVDHDYKNKPYFMVLGGASFAAGADREYLKKETGGDRTMLAMIDKTFGLGIKESSMNGDKTAFDMHVHYSQSEDRTPKGQGKSQYSHPLPERQQVLNDIKAASLHACYEAKYVVHEMETSILPKAREEAETFISEAIKEMGK